MITNECPIPFSDAGSLRGHCRCTCHLLTLETNKMWIFLEPTVPSSRGIGQGKKRGGNERGKALHFPPLRALISYVPYFHQNHPGAKQTMERHREGCSPWCVIVVGGAPWRLPGLTKIQAGDSPLATCTWWVGIAYSYVHSSSGHLILFLLFFVNREAVVVGTLSGWTLRSVRGLGSLSLPCWSRRTSWKIKLLGARKGSGCCGYGSSFLWLCC